MGQERPGSLVPAGSHRSGQDSSSQGDTCGLLTTLALQRFTQEQECTQLFDLGHQVGKSQLKGWRLACLALLPFLFF